MAIKRVLVLHGPNLNLLGERPGDERGVTLDMLNHRLQQVASELGLEVRAYQSNHEGDLVDRLHAERRWADAVVVSPDALAHSSYVLREALAAAGRPAIEVHLTDIRRRESWRRKSLIKDVCQGQVLGKGIDSYVIALRRLASGDLAGRRRLPPAPARRDDDPGEVGVERSVEKSVWRGDVRASGLTDSGVEKTVAATKTLGRRSPAPRADTPAVELLTRALVRQKISERLSGQLSAAALASWAKSRWLQVQQGAPAEPGHRQLLEDSLQALTLSAMGAAQLGDEQLVDLMTQLDG